MMNAGLLDLDPEIHPAYHHEKQKGVSFLPQTHLYHHDSHEEEERSLTNEENSADDFLGKPKKSLPWQRIKWTDDMVHLLISTIASVEDDGVNENSSKRKLAASGGLLHKKGKWKTISKFMLEKGCYVSPQQCEDEFNDLNRRYKRLNEILGTGKLLSRDREREKNMGEREKGRVREGKEGERRK